MENKKLPSRSFCILPWIQIFSGLKGTHRICCHSVTAKDFVNHKEEVLFLHKHDIEDIWNCKSLRDIRMKMLKGEQFHDCDLCYTMEDRAGISHRLNYFTIYYEDYLSLKQSGVFEATLTNKGLTKFNPLYLSCNLGNKCNLSCRMCSPHSSILKGKELFQYLKSTNISNNNDSYILPPDFISIDKATNSDIPWQVHFNEFQESFNYTNDKRYWHQVEKCIPYLKFLVIHGGEPILYENEIESIIDKINGERRNREMDLAIITNLTLDSYDFFKKLIDYDWLVLHVVFSIDGYKNLQEYIRYPQKWEIFENNLMKLLELSDKIDISISLTVQAYNAFHLTDVLDYIETFWDTNQIDTNVTFLTVPPFLKTDVLPENIKKKAIVKINEFINRSRSINDENCTFQLENNLKIVIEDLQNEDPNLHERRMEFVKYTRTLDELRGQKILDVCPEMETLFT